MKRKVPEVIFIKGNPYVHMDIVAEKNHGCFEHAIKHFRKAFLEDMHERIANGEDILVREDKKHMQNIIKNMRVVEHALDNYWGTAKELTLEEILRDAS